MPDILKDWRKLPKQTRSVELRINTLKMLEEEAAERGISFDEALDHFLIFAFLQRSRMEILSYVAEMKIAEAQAAGFGCDCGAPDCIGPAPLLN